jgi:hypothetical protein
VLASIWAGSARAEPEPKLFGHHDTSGWLGVSYLTGTNAEAPAQGAYSRLHGDLGGHAGVIYQTTRFGTLVGIEVAGSIGYGGEEHYAVAPSQPRKASLALDFDGGLSFGLLSWSHGVRGRFTVWPGVGFTVDGARWYGSHGYVFAGGRLTLFPGDDLDVNLQYLYTPAATGDGAYQAHRGELQIEVGPVSFGLRGELDQVAAKDTAAQRQLRGSLFIGTCF